jgi:ankyrin repeat protein
MGLLGGPRLADLQSSFPPAHPDVDALVAAAGAGQLPQVRALLQRPGVDVNAPSSQGDTALYSAALACRLDVMRFLIEQGASLRSFSPRAASPLGGAAMAGHPKAVQFLLDKGADPNERRADGWSPLMLAAIVIPGGTGHLRCMELLIEAGADVNFADVDDGRTALMVAAMEGRGELMRSPCSTLPGSRVHAPPARSSAEFPSIPETPGPSCRRAHAAADAAAAALPCAQGTWSNF